MSYDEVLAARVRERVAGEGGVTEKRMFGGLAFLLHGSLAVAVSGQGGLLARVSPGDAAVLNERDGVAPMVMNGRQMRGWLRVAPDVVAVDATLDEWVARCVTYVRDTVNAPDAARA
jgi:hypothetical protein